MSYSLTRKHNQDKGYLNESDLRKKFDTLHALGFVNKKKTMIT